MSISNFIFSLKSFFLVQLSLLVFVGLVTSADMSPGSLHLQVGATSQIQTTAKNTNGQIVQDVPTQWSATNVNVATIDQSGDGTGISIGAAIQEGCTPFTKHLTKYFAV
jgi:uncharacterized secreted protein with C-terminal beta-propeller domain